MTLDPRIVAVLERHNATPESLADQRRHAWAQIQRMGPDAERVVRDVCADANFGRLGGLPTVRWGMTDVDIV